MVLFLETLTKAGDKMATSMSDEIESVSLYNLRPTIFHGYVFPFLFSYSFWLYFWVVVYGVNEYFEAGLIALAFIGCAQILVCLFCHWSVHIRCSLTCSKVGTISKFSRV